LLRKKNEREDLSKEEDTISTFVRRATRVVGNEGKVFERGGGLKGRGGMFYEN